MTAKISLCNLKCDNLNINVCYYRSVIKKKDILIGFQILYKNTHCLNYLILMTNSNDLCFQGSFVPSKVNLARFGIVAIFSIDAKLGIHAILALQSHIHHNTPLPNHHLTKERNMLFISSYIMLHLCDNAKKYTKCIVINKLLFLKYYKCHYKFKLIFF